MRFSCIWLTIWIVALSGCIQTKTIEELGIINTRGVDIGEDGKIKTTLVILKFDQQSQELSKIVTGKGNTIKGARKNANYKTSFRLTPGQIHLELYGREAAEKGLLPYLDTVIRDARVSDTMYLTVSNTTAKEIIIKGKSEAPVNVGRYLHNIIEQNIKDNILPRVSLQDFLHTYYDPGKDPVLPIARLQNAVPSIAHLGIFRDDKLVGQIPINKAFLVNIFHKTVDSLFFETSLPIKPFENYISKVHREQTQEEKFYATFKVLEGASKTKLINHRALKFQTTVNLDLSLFELSKEIKIGNPEVIKLLEKQMNKRIKQKYNKLLNKLQQLNADSFGYGTIYRINKPSGKLTTAEWRDKFPTIDVDFKINVRILRHGTTP